MYIYSKYLSDIYEPLRILHQGENSCVTLVRHRELGSVRVLKQIPQAGLKQTDLMEGEILKNLRHEGIPILYDLAAGDREVYLVEEYVEGMSLREYLFRHSLTERQLVEYTLQIVRILTYLHTRPRPICYQDLKPEHIMVCGNRVRLIDYGISHFLSHSGASIPNFGTTHYAAPEQFTGERLQESSDIYSLGMVTLTMMKYLEGKPSWKLIALQRQMVRRQPEKRVALSFVEEVLCQMLMRDPVSDRKRESLHKTIAILGAAPGIGTTHIAISTTVFLNRTGIRSFYRSQAEVPVLQRIRKAEPVFCKDERVIYHRDFYGYLTYADTIEEAEPPEGIQVYDVGTDRSLASEADLVICIIGSRAWMEEYREDIRLSGKVIYVLNPSNPVYGMSFAKAMGREVYGFPIDRDPWTMTRKKKSFFRRLWKEDLRQFVEE